MGENENNSGPYYREETSDSLKSIEKKEEKKISPNGFDNKEEIASKVFFGTIMISIFVIIIGLIWGIADLIEPEGKWEWFVQQALYTQVFYIALMVLFLLIVGIFITVFYRRGRNWLLQGLFGKKPSEFESSEEYLPAKIIAGGMLVSIAVVVLGLLIAFFQEYVAGIDSSGFIGLVDIQSGGLRLLLVGIFIQIIVWLILGFLYIWQNGYYFVMNYILRYNKKFVDPGYNEKQKIIGRVFFVITVVSVILILGGIVYSIMDAVQPEGKWDSFKTYAFGLQFAILGIFFVGLFGLLVGSMMLYKWGNILILDALFLNRNKKLDEDEKTKIAKVLTWGIMITIFAIIVSAISYLISVGFELEGVNIFNLGTLSGGLTVLLIGMFILLFDVLILLFSFIYKNGYALMVVQVIKLQDGFEKKMFERKEAKKKEKGLPKSE